MHSFVTTVTVDIATTVYHMGRVDIVPPVNSITNKYKELNMPHVDKPTKEALNTTDRQVVKMGDACYLFANLGLQMYNADPSWTTIHKVRVMCRTPWHDEQAHALIRAKMGHMSKVDVDTAADLAFFEFYRIIGAGHEDCKIIENGSAFEGAKIPRPEIKEAVTSSEPTEPVPPLQGVEEAHKGRRKRVDNQAV